ncbi:MAG: HEPN domain-containing protein [Rhodospirillales bacterium]|nr:HEPN domain-containing protein [Rhodospirillales bacterium]
MQKAGRFLRSVNRRAPSDEPEAVASTAYYAMHHAACAVLLHHGKSLPKTHSSLIGLFGLVVRDLGPEGREAGAALHNAFETRSTGDYSAAVRLTRADAIAAREAAQSFVAYCRTLQRKSPQRRK